MKANELVENIGTLLGEDFTNNPLWSEEELFKDLQVVLSLFGELTMLVDRCRVCLVDYVTGEMTLPLDLGQVYLGQYSQELMDIVDLGESEFLEETWGKDTTGSPKGMVVWGLGGEGVGRFIPVPSTIEVPAGGGSGVSEIELASPDTSVWKVTVGTDGVLSTSAGTTADPTQVIEGYGSYWDLSIDNSGVLTLSSSSSTTSSDLVLVDSGGVSWAVGAGLGGVLVTDLSQIGAGLLTGIIITKDGVDTYQDGNSDYGILVDIYSDGVSTTPDHVAKMERDYGFVQFCGQYTGQGTVWYKGLPQELYSLYNEVVVSDGLLPIIMHGVLSRALAKEGDGQDLEKSRLLSGVFVSECAAIRDTFGKRW